MNKDAYLKCVVSSVGSLNSWSLVGRFYYEIVSDTSACENILSIWFQVESLLTHNWREDPVMPPYAKHFPIEIITGTSDRSRFCTTEPRYLRIVMHTVSWRVFPLNMIYHVIENAKDSIGSLVSGVVKIPSFDTPSRNSSAHFLLEEHDIYHAEQIQHLLALPWTGVCGREIFNVSSQFVI